MHIASHTFPNVKLDANIAILSTVTPTVADVGLNLDDKG
jgi:hypothetical protein